MRITRDALMKIVHTTVEQRTRSNRGLIAIYLCGSLLGDEYLLGGTTDIDLVFIHSDVIAGEREIVPLTEQVSLDIAHHYHREYRNPRNLRLHPWLGPTIYNCNILYDPQHLMDFTQASVRGQFFRPETILERARIQAEHARQIWMGFVTEGPEAAPTVIVKYLHALEHAANAVAVLNGSPLTERRFLQHFPARAEAAHHPGLYPGLLGLLGGSNVDAEALQAWLPAWQAAYEALPEGETPARFHPARKAYYRAGFESLLRGDEPKAVIWPMMRTWTQLASLLPHGSEATSGWESAANYLGFLGSEFDQKVSAMDAYLDMVEETLEDWAAENGVQRETV